MTKNHSFIEAVFHCASCKWNVVGDIPFCEHYERPLHEVASISCDSYDPDDLCDTLP